MNKSPLNHQLLKYHDLIGYALALTTLCLLVTWGIELLAKEWMRMG